VPVPCSRPPRIRSGWRVSELDTARAAVASTDQLQSGGAADVLQVRAPVAARVLKLLQESEGAVAAGQPLLEIGNPTASKSRSRCCRPTR